MICFVQSFKTGFKHALSYIYLDSDLSLSCMVTLTNQHFKTDLEFASTVEWIFNEAAYFVDKSFHYGRIIHFV